MKLFITFISGLIFAVGLGISGMTQPHIVRGFLDVFGSWDPSLVGVMAGAIMVHAVAYKLIMKRSSPLMGATFDLPTKKIIDRRLILGAIIFGLGWGWAGICPGPGLVSLVSGDLSFIIFVASMIIGMLVFQFFGEKK